MKKVAACFGKLYDPLEKDCRQCKDAVKCKDALDWKQRGFDASKRYDGQAMPCPHPNDRRWITVRALLKKWITKEEILTRLKNIDLVMLNAMLYKLRDEIKKKELFKINGATRTHNS